MSDNNYVLKIIINAHSVIKCFINLHREFLYQRFLHQLLLMVVQKDHSFYEGPYER